jgi:hypothetical protein
MFRQLYFSLSLAVLVARFALLLPWRLACGLIRARGFVLRSTLTTIVLLTISGFSRNSLGLNSHILRLLDYVQSGWENVLYLTGLVAGIRHILAPLPLCVGIWAACWILVSYIRKVESYVQSLYLLVIQDHIGIRLAGVQLKLLLSLPVWVAFTLCWPGIEGLIALANTVIILVFLHRFIDKQQARRSVEHSTRFHTSMAGMAGRYIDGSNGADFFEAGPGTGGESPLPAESTLAKS